MKSSLKLPGVYFCILFLHIFTFKYALSFLIPSKYKLIFPSVPEKSRRSAHNRNFLKTRFISIEPSQDKNECPDKRSPTHNNQQLEGFSRRDFLKIASFCPALIGLLELQKDTAHAQETVLATDNTRVVNFPNPSIKLLETVEQSPNDQRSYRALELKNRLTVLLVSDPEATTAAAAMDVHVGHFSDPSDLPGLAHFCEHMLFLGTEKYPREDEFSMFLAQHGGTSNAFTDTQDTVYYFDINSDFLKPALDRFSQFFIAPLFTESATGRELNAIESENSKNFQSDGFRLYQFEKSLANPDHPYSKFGTGNLETLQKLPSKKGLDIRKALKDFHSTYYSSNMMTLCIVGKQSLNELQTIATTFFEDVPLLPYARLPELSWDGVIPVLKTPKVAVGYGVVPIEDKRLVSLTWTLPYSELWAGKFGFKERQSLKPDVYIGSLLGYEGKGSLLSFLKKKGWVNGLGASEGTETSGFQNFEITADLTPSGQENRFKVVAAIFSYLCVLEKEGIPEYVYTDLIRLSNIGWMFLEKSESSNFATACASNMQKWTPKKYLSGQIKLEGYSDELNREFLKRLVPQDARLISISKDFASTANQKERWYGTKYKVERIDAQLVEWKNAPLVPEMNLPQANPYIPTDLSLKGPKRLIKTGPRIIQDSSSWRIHFKQDLSFGQPKVYAVVQLFSPVPYSSPKAVAAFKMHQLYVKDSLSELIYDAEVAGLNYELEFNTKGARLGFGGYNDKINLLVNQVLKTVRSPGRPSVQEFERYRDIVLRELDGFDKQQPYFHAAYRAGLVTETPRWDVYEIKEALKEVQIKDIDEYISKAFDRSFGEALVQGNMDEKEALQLVMAVEEAVSFSPLPPEERPEKLVVELPKGPLGTLVEWKEPNPDETNSAVHATFQFPGRALSERVCIELIGVILEQPFYDDLRTKQQLGYIVGAGIKRVQGITSLSLVVQSNVKDPIYITGKILEFIEMFDKTLDDLSDKQFDEFRKGLIEKKLEPLKRLIAAATRNWEEIITGEYLYDRAEQEASALKSLTKGQLLDYFREYMKKTGASRRLLVSQVFGNKDRSKLKYPQDEFALIEDLQIFKEERPKYEDPKKK